MSRELVYDNTDSLTGGRPVRQGFYNAVDVFASAGTFKWDKKSLLDPNSHILVRVWGAGGSCGTQAGSGNAYGGGGGGLAVKHVSVSDLLASETLVVGAGQAIYNAQAGASSFGNHCSATGGNSGYNNADNAGREVYGGGGMGIGGDLNRRGGDGGSGSLNSSIGCGGGGGSAPHPDGYQNGFKGGNASQRYVGASGASINYPGVAPYTHYTAPGGAGTSGAGVSSTKVSSSYGYGGQGGAGLLGAGGRGASVNTYSNNTATSIGAESGQGSAIIEPNRIFFGGGGGGGGAACYWSSERAGAVGGNGGPGAGGGAATAYSSDANHAYTLGGNGGILGGGGGAGQHCAGGHGGNAGGGGAGGYVYGTNTKHGFGGHGLIIIQYRLLFSN